MTTFMTQFIYQPQSGSRIFVEKACPAILKFQWRNGSCHVAGGVYLVLRPDGSRIGRGALTSLVTQVVERHGGIGWDAQGCVQAIVPAPAALVLNNLCRSLETAGGLLDVKLGIADLASQMFLQGLGFVSDKGFEVVGWCEEPAPVTVTGASWVRTESGRRLVIETTEGTIKVPESWVVLETAGPWGTPLEVSEDPPTQEWEGWSNHPIQGMGDGQDS